jgi:hypothetical protein
MTLTASQIIDLLGGTVAVAEGIGAPPSTVSSWKVNGIPDWRKAALEMLAARKGVTLIFGGADGAPVPPEAAGVTICGVCELRADQPEVKACTYAACGLRQRLAA